MAAEVEAKFWLERPDEKTASRLGLDSIIHYDVGQIRRNIQRLTGAEAQVHDLLDRFYVKPDLTRGYSADDLDNLVRLEGGQLIYNGNAISLSVEGNKNLEEEVAGFIKVLKTYFSSKDNGANRSKANQIRLREDMVTKSIYLTLKCKHGEADEKTEEYEFLVLSRFAAEDFLAKLGYELRPDRTKGKRQEKHSFERDGVKINVEINSIDYLGGARFLEIEAVAQSLEKSPDITSVYQIARELGVQNPELNTLHGGNREDRRYQELQRIARTASETKFLWRAFDFAHIEARDSIMWEGDRDLSRGPWSFVYQDWKQPEEGKFTSVQKVLGTLEQRLDGVYFVPNPEITAGVVDTLRGIGRRDYDLNKPMMPGDDIYLCAADNKILGRIFMLETPKRGE